MVFSLCNFLTNHILKSLQCIITSSKWMWSSSSPNITLMYTFLQYFILTSCSVTPGSCFYPLHYFWLWIILHFFHPYAFIFNAIQFIHPNISLLSSSMMMSTIFWIISLCSCLCSSAPVISLAWSIIGHWFWFHLTSPFELFYIHGYISFLPPASSRTPFQFKCNKIINLPVVSSLTSSANSCTLCYCFWTVINSSTSEAFPRFVVGVSIRSFLFWAPIGSNPPDLFTKAPELTWLELK